MQQRLIDLSYEASGIREELERNNFETFKLRLFPNMILDENKPSPRKNMKNLATIAHDYAESFPDNHPHSLIFYGAPGTGKTFLCDCIAKRVLDRGFTVLYLTANQLCSNLDEYRFRRNPARAEQTQIIHDQLDQVDLLIIDDLGTELDNAFTSSELFRVVNERGMKKLSTVISTNFSLKDLAQAYSERILSRITSDYTIIRLTGEDIRIRKKLSGGRL
jgi:DNA replication protein DnaC